MAAWKNAVLNAASSILMVTLALCMGSCWRSPENEARARLDAIAQQVRLLEETAGNGDPEVETLVARAHEQMAEVSNCLIESDYDKARKILDELSDRLANYASLTDRRLKADLRFFGPATSFQSSEQGSFEEVTGREDVEAITALKTGARSLVALKLNPKVDLELQNESMVHIMRKGTSVELNLDHGTIRLICEPGANAVKLIQGKLTVALVGQADLELARNEIIRTGYLANYGPELSWQVNDARGTLKTLEGLSWSGRSPETVNLNLPPHIELPNNQSTYHADKGDIAGIEFRWYTQINSDAFQLQISDHNLFATRVYDNLLETSTHINNLPIGTYFWRIRGATKDKSGQFIPGPYNKTMVVYVSKSGLPVTKVPVKVGRKEAPKPVVDNFKIETIGTSVIVSGRTKPTMRVKANGTSAILDDDGVFRAIIDLEPGVQTIRLEVTDPKTGSEAIIEKQVKI